VKVYKYGTVSNNNEVVTHDNHDTFFIKEYETFRRITIAPGSDEVELLLEIVSGFEPPLKVIYALFRPGNFSVEPGRYHCQDEQNFIDVELFCRRFKKFFETDGRHHIWFLSANDRGIKQFLIYDNHHLLHVNDDVDRIMGILSKRNFRQEQTVVPEPHIHLSDTENDVFEKELLEYWNWVRVPFRHPVKATFKV
jgi:hypothetical protein